VSQLSATLPALAALVLVGATCQREPAPARRAPPTGAIGERAFAHVTKLVGFGPRHFGTEGWARSVDYIAATLRGLGLDPVRDRWLERDENVTFENLHVTLPGQVADRIVIGCHHDTKKTSGHPQPEHNFPFVGANDSASGVGLLLSLAAELRDRPRRASLQLVFFDGEESMTWDWREGARALFGSKRFVRQQRDAELLGGANGRILAFVLLDMVGARDLQIDRDANSTPELVDIFAETARGLGYESWFFQTETTVSDDHLPFVEAGIPSIDLIDIARNPEWHTHQDTLDHIAPESLQLVGEVVLAALPRLEERFVRPRGDVQLPKRR
jgi:hypothetical protein